MDGPTIERRDPHPGANVHPDPGDAMWGRNVGRLEDAALVTGRARYTEDLAAPGAAHAAFVRSHLPHARIVATDWGDTAEMPGVVGLFAAGDLEVAPVWGSERMHESFARPALAREVVRFAGEPVTVMVAETRAEALDATERVVLEMDPLPAVVEPERPSRPTCRCCFPMPGRTWPGSCPRCNLKAATRSTAGPSWKRNRSAPGIRRLKSSGEVVPQVRQHLRLGLDPPVYEQAMGRLGPSPDVRSARRSGGGLRADVGGEPAD